MFFFSYSTLLFSFFSDVPFFSSSMLSFYYLVVRLPSLCHHFSPPPPPPLPNPPNAHMSISPARKVLIAQLQTARAGPAGGAPMLDGSCSPHAVLERVWVQGHLRTVSAGLHSVDDGTGQLLFHLANPDDDGDEGVEADTETLSGYAQVCGAVDFGTSDVRVAADACVALEGDAAARAEACWPAEVADFQARFVFTS
eukprot:Rhum_TRINITY_DN14159_c1_g1::Rhum_TRINITY_DN14159_c1_g1_i1::g.71158::m.71158